VLGITVPPVSQLSNPQPHLVYKDSHNRAGKNRQVTATMNKGAASILWQ